MTNDGELEVKKGIKTDKKVIPYLNGYEKVI